MSPDEQVIPVKKSLFLVIGAQQENFGEEAGEVYFVVQGLGKAQQSTMEENEECPYTAAAQVYV